VAQLLTRSAAAQIGHEHAITNVSASIAKLGKHTGVDITPFTIFYTVRND
jgi:hypothetical protein